MATTLTNLDQAKIELSIQAALKNALVPISAFSLGVSTEGMNKDDVIKVPVLTDPTSQSKTLGTAITVNGTVTGVSVTLDTPIQAGFEMVEGTVNPAQAQAYAEGLATGATFSICKAIVDAAFGLVTNANYATKVTVPVADFGQKDIGDLFAAAEAKKLGRQRSLILNGPYAGSLIGESSLGLILATLGDQALKTASLPPLMGMTSYLYSGLPSNSENLGGMVIDKTAIAIAISPVNNLLGSGDGDVMGQSLITDPDSGITVGYRMVGDGDGGKFKVLITAMYGVAKVQDAIVRLVTA